MKNPWSIRMRAAKTVQGQKSRVKSPNLELKTQNLKIPEIHISGAEGLYKKSEIQAVVNKYIKRALNHSRGKADKIVITIEDIKQQPETITALPVVTIENTTSQEGGKIAGYLLRAAGISKIAIDKAFELIKRDSMRGAIFITDEHGRRLEPDTERGVRVSGLGITTPQGNCVQ